METITTLITNVGFPIGMCIMLMVYIKQLGDNHKQETKEFTDALNRNTQVLQSLADKLDEVLR